MIYNGSKFVLFNSIYGSNQYLHNLSRTNDSFTIIKRCEYQKSIRSYTSASCLTDT